MSVSMCDSIGDDRQLVLPDSGEIDHCKELSEDIGALVLNQDYSDVTFVVDGKSFPAHRVILAARCHYFRALLYGGMRESKPEARIPIDDCTPEAFSLLLHYIYTGKLKLADLTEECVLEILGLSNKYGFPDLERGVSNFLLKSLSISNACEVYGVATLYSLSHLQDAAAEFVDRNALDILNNEAFLGLSLDAVTSIIKRDSFCASERAIFKAVEAWWDQNKPPQRTDEEKPIFEASRQQLLRGVRLPLMSLQELLHTVRPSGLISADMLLDAIQRQSEHSNADLNYRGILCPEENVATMQHGAQVIKGEMCAALLDGDTAGYDMERGFTRHSIEEAVAGNKADAGIVVKLGRPSIINHIRMLLWDKDMRAYSYYVEVSMDDKDWVRVIDYSRFFCRSWQNLYFSKRVVRYIRIVGTHNTANKVFHIVALEAMFTRTMEVMEDGFVVPQRNVATVASSASVIEGVSRDRNALLNGDVSAYDWDSGYTCHQLGNGAIVIQLNQPYKVSSIRLLLWDIDERSYSYYIETSTNQSNWRRVVDNSKKECRSWQSLTLPRQPVVFIRIVGTNNTANEVFHCVHFECPDSTVPAPPMDVLEEAPGATGHVSLSEGGWEAPDLKDELDTDASSRSSGSSHRAHQDASHGLNNMQDENAGGEGRGLMRQSRGHLGSFQMNPHKR